MTPNSCNPEYSKSGLRSIATTATQCPVRDKHSAIPTVSEVAPKPREQFMVPMTTYKVKVSGGDIKAVQGENGQKDAKMVTHQYSRILDEDRSRIADIMDAKFYGKNGQTEEDEMIQSVKANPELFKQFMAFMSMASANKI